MYKQNTQIRLWTTPYPSYDAHLTGTIISHILTLHITSLRTSTIGCNPFEQNSSIYTCMIVTISQVYCKKPSNHDYSRKPWEFTKLYPNILNNFEQENVSNLEKSNQPLGVIHEVLVLRNLPRDVHHSPASESRYFFPLLSNTYTPWQ